MPMSFPDFDSLKRRATLRKFRQPMEDESEDAFRNEFADFMLKVDRVESAEIRSKVGWDVLQCDPETMLNLMGIDTTSLFK